MGLLKNKEIEAPRILIIDDDSNILEIYRGFLGQETFKVTFLTSPQDAWKALETQSFDLIITDLQMPFLDGEELIEIIRKKNEFNKTPIIIASGASNKIHESQAERDPYLFLIKKPFGKDQFLKEIKKVIKTNLL